MPQYSVNVTRDTTETAEIIVDADSAEEAEQMAISQSYTAGLIWEQDYTPNASRDHYTNGAEEVE